MEARKSPGSLFQFCLLCQAHAVEAETVPTSAAPGDANPLLTELEQQCRLLTAVLLLSQDGCWPVGGLALLLVFEELCQCSLLAELVQGSPGAACTSLPRHPGQKTGQGFWGHSRAAGHEHNYQTSCVQARPNPKLPSRSSGKLSALWSVLHLRVAGGSEASCDASAKF